MIRKAIKKKKAVMSDTKVISLRQTHHRFNDWGNRPTDNKEADLCQNYEAGLKFYRGEWIDHGLPNKERD